MCEFYFLYLVGLNSVSLNRLLQSTVFFYKIMSRQLCCGVIENCLTYILRPKICHNMSTLKIESSNIMILIICHNVWYMTFTSMPWLSLGYFPWLHSFVRAMCCHVDVMLLKLGDLPTKPATIWFKSSQVFGIHSLFQAFFDDDRL